MKKNFLTNSPEETLQLARNLAHELRAGDVVALCGELGAGKTCFAKGIVSELAHCAPDEVLSPTFTLLEDYPTTPRLFHLDLYRLTSEEAARDLPWDELFSPEVITLIEWPDRLPQLLSHCKIEIDLSRGNKENQRMIQIVRKVESGGL